MDCTGQFAGAVTAAPTCRATGLMTYACAVCGASYTETLEIDPDAHTWDEGTVTTEPTCEAAGVRTFTCTSCAATKSGAVDALGHDWDADTHQCRRCEAVQPVVAKIESVEYYTLDAAIGAAEDGDTIEVLDDCQTEKGFGLGGTTLTVNGNHHKITAATKGIYLAKGKDAIAKLTFENCELDLCPSKGTPTVGGEGYPWAAAVVNYDCELSFINSDVTFKPVVASAIYYHLGSKFNLDNSVVMIDGFSGSAFQTDDQQKAGVYTTELNVINGSSLTASKCYAGITSTIQVTVEDSVLNDCSNRGNGSNGADYFVKNSTVNFSGNGSHGMSARDIRIEGSTVTCDGNGFCGITATSTIYIDEASTVTVTNNGKKTDAGTSWKNHKAAFRIMGTECLIEEGANVRIADNYNSGIQVSSTAVMTMLAGTVTGNGGRTSAAPVGGGLYNEGEFKMGDDARLYNNYAPEMGDDVYSTGTVTLIDEPKSMGLKLKVDCNEKHTITGWFYDGRKQEDGAVVSTRLWNADAEKAADRYYEQAETLAYTGEIALKAAHPYIAPTEEPKDPDTPYQPPKEDPKDPVVIPEEPTPLEPAPVGTPELPATEIPEEEIPMAEVPKTGDSAALWLALSGISGSGLTAMSLLGRKKRED